MNWNIKLLDIVLDISTNFKVYKTKLEIGFLVLYLLYITL